jgi:hypothetical protein
MNGKLLIILLPAFFLASCGTTHLVVLNPDADIYVNHVYKGTGTATLVRTGPPRKVTAEVRYMGRTIGSIDLKRKFDLVTLFAGCYSYGLGFICAWRYPGLVIVPVENHSCFGDNQSIWDKPPGDWKK